MPRATLLLAVVACAVCSPARADEPGLTIALGAGVSGFTDHAMRGATSLAGAWELRGAWGTRSHVALELAYIGSANGVDSLYGHESATLFGTTFEGHLRLAAAPRATWSPYAFAGLGYQRFSIDEHDFSLADTGVASTGDVVEIPLGAGFVYRAGRIVTDLRGSFRAALGTGIILSSPATGTLAPMHAWQATLAVGYEL